MMAQANKGGKGLNLNKATIETLEKFGGIGRKLAQDIVNYRNEHGPFKSFDDLTNISGISRKMVENLKKEGVEIR